MVKYGENVIAKTITELEEILMDGTNRTVNADPETFLLIVRWFRSNSVASTADVKVLRHNGKPYYYIFGKIHTLESFRNQVERQMEFLATLVDEHAGYGIEN